MLELKKICKSYITSNFKQHALKDFSLKFRKNEFVAILGPSGSGKTTLLNIIGGLDRYDSGDLIINGKSTKKFNDTTWDAYRNNSVGFIFQSYNLIPHITILENVEMSLTLSGVSNAEKKEKALSVLEKVGLQDHINKKPNQLSGGQMQRVAIARALVNDPDLILADEPTGALDTKTSIQIMELIKEISKNKLVIMVTHNKELAESYATRIVELRDGELVNDTNPIKNEEKIKEDYNIKKTSMSFWTALKLSFNNIKTKKGRTILTAFASSIGIIGIALILSLSNGFDIEIDKFEKDTLSNLPIIISSQAVSMDENMMGQLTENFEKNENSYTDKKIIYPKQKLQDTISHTNIFTKEYIDYIENIDPELISGIAYQRSTSINIISKKEDVYSPLTLNYTDFFSIPKTLSESNNTGVVKENFDLLYGKYPSNKSELLLVLDTKNRISSTILEQLGLDSTKETINFEEISNINLKLILNNEYYIKYGNYYTVNTNFKELYENNNAIELKVVGIVRAKEESERIYGNVSGLFYSNELLDFIIDSNKDSEIVKSQEKANYNILTGEAFNETNTKDLTLGYLGADTVPVVINVYPKDFNAKDKITNYLDEYNKNKEENDKIIYNDLGQMISSMSGSIMDAITMVLIAFSSISLVVSVIMIGIITYISVLERIKEIGILRALGARKKDISRVFNAETFIIGTISGLIGIIIARLLVFPTNSIIYNATDLPNVAKLNPVHALILILISVTLTVIGGSIPAKMASKKDPVIALRTE